MCILVALKDAIWGSKPWTYFVFFTYIYISNMDNKTDFLIAPTPIAPNMFLYQDISLFA